MNTSRLAVTIVFGMFSLIVVSPCHAAFHFWDIREVYSNADGSVQFIELFTTLNSQQFVSNHDITTTANTFTFPVNSPSPTSNKHLLLATADFASLDGGVTPDYTLPANFFDPAGDTINFIGADMVTFAAAPTNGTDSLNYPGGNVAVNSPTNFAGDAGSLVPPPAVLFGDADNDGAVSGSDLLAVTNNFGNTGPADGFLLGDCDDDGAVTGADLLCVTNNFGNTLAGVQSAPVPEPNSLVLLLVCGSFAGVRYLLK